MGRTLLAPVAFFEENLGPVDALKRSFELTKGHVLELLGALFAGSLLTGGNGLLAPAASLAPIVGRYEDLVALKKSGAPKPPIHWWNYVLPILTVVAIVLYIILIITTVDDRKSEHDKVKTYPHEYGQPIRNHDRSDSYYR